MLVRICRVQQPQGQWRSSLCIHECNPFSTMGMASRISRARINKIWLSQWLRITRGYLRDSSNSNRCDCISCKRCRCSNTNKSRTNNCSSFSRPVQYRSKLDILALMTQQLQLISLQRRHNNIICHSKQCRCNHESRKFFTLQLFRFQTRFKTHRRIIPCNSIDKPRDIPRKYPNRTTLTLHLALHCQHPRPR